MESGDNIQEDLIFLVLDAIRPPRPESNFGRQILRSNQLLIVSISSASCTAFVTAVGGLICSTESLGGSRFLACSHILSNGPSALPKMSQTQM